MFGLTAIALEWNYKYRYKINYGNDISKIISDRV